LQYFSPAFQTAARIRYELGE